jgi:hypothetical protein
MKGLAGIKKRAGVLLIMLFTVMPLLFGGCAQEEVTTEKPKVPEKVDLASKLSLNEIVNETTAVIETTWTPYSIDEILSFVSGKRPKVVKREEVRGGPVNVDIVFPSNGSLIDRQIEFRAFAYSESGTVDRVDFYLDGVKVNSLTSPPYTFSFNPDAYGKSEHTLKVVAISGDFSDTDSIKFYNVVKRSLVIYPWVTSGGNIPYSHIKNLYLPDLEKKEVAMFTAYTSSDFYVDFKTKLASGYAVMAAKITAQGMVVADSNPNVFWMRFYDYAQKRFNDNYLYQMELKSSFAPGPEKPYEMFSFVPRAEGEYSGAGQEGNIIPFYGINPFTHEIWLRIHGQGPTKFYLEPIVVEYYAVEDNIPPKIRYRRCYIRDGSVIAEFYVSEPSFVTITAYDSNGGKRSYTAAKPEGWNEISINDSNTLKISLKAVDCAGHTVTTSLKKVSR